MLIIRFQRVGKKNQAMFRIVLAEKHRAVEKKVQEILGYYNPRGKQFGINDPERLKYWIDQHVQISPTVHNLFVDKGILSSQKVKAWRPKPKATEDTPPKTEVSEATTSGQESHKAWRFFYNLIGFFQFFL